MGPGASIFGSAGPKLRADERAFFAAARPWGFILFARNIENPDQLRALCGDLRHSVGRDAPILIDQEGGRVQRMGPPHWRDWPPALEQVARAGAHGARVMWLRYRIIAHELRGAGIDGNCAPLGDIAHDHTHPVLKNRLYGFEGKSVAALARAVADGLMAGGVMPVLKHLPGQGRARTDSHTELPHVSASAATLETSDFAPFRALNDLALGMSAHVVYDALSQEAATQCARVIGLIRTQIGFDGLLLSDDISMQALQGDLQSRSARALGAGCEVIVHCNGDLAEMEMVAASAGELDAVAQARGARALALRERTEEFDLQAGLAELAELTGEAAHV